MKQIFWRNREHIRTLCLQNLCINSCFGSCSPFDNEFRQLLPQENALCEAPVTLEELGFALKQLPN